LAARPRAPSFQPLTLGAPLSYLLEIRDLEVAFPTAEGVWLPLLRGVSLDVGAGEIVGLVGESGSGKTMLSLAALDLLPAPCRVRGGSVRWRGRELRDLAADELRRVRGGEMALVHQEPAAALTPVATLGVQLVEVLRAHGTIGRAEAREAALGLLEEVALPEPARRYGEYPHELSGGQRQRALLALALAGRPDLLLADEPTAALDVSLQAKVLDAIVGLRSSRGLAVLLISHDLAVVAERCDRVYVLYGGEIVETGVAAELLGRPAHPYTRALLATVPAPLALARQGPLPTIPGQVPSPAERPSGCTFHPRCAERLARCAQEEPPWRGDAARGARCWLPLGEGDSTP